MTSVQISKLAAGTVSTIELTLISIVLGMILALVIAFMSIGRNKILKGIAWIYTWVFRGTPLLLQIMVVYFAIPLMVKQMVGSPLNFEPFTAAIIALTLNTAAYTSEIFRAGIQSIDKGQMEAAKALGMTYSQAMFKVIIPQTVSRVIPPFANEFIMILKDTSLVSTIGMADLMRVSKQFAASGDWSYYFVAGGIYLVLTSVCIVLFQRLEKKTSRYI
ncbi:amino acid ABC transporter permease [Anaerofustis stercorihominis]|uniref:ABC transporter, permease protein n=1 Tax=Anaerofustis stercorihominis DSM 17244 TaxID=445971 RepID=B1C866_9FIRM|nr:amino acid ABC transporter permease [Anaerofustis stercorihominis]EDS73203.1 ABC transporter, permease protein [Anaerofustis stercorihominis DSM 17244]MCQ4794502.1 amino acid ABC transporter permease [Anaerofustis stercorihominis]